MKPGKINIDSWALVTGAGSGIGRCYALRLAAMGYRIAIVGDTESKLRSVEPELLAAGAPQVEVLVCDLARVEAAQQLYDQTQALQIHVDVLINNAGAFLFCDLLAISSQRIERLILLHDLTTVQLCRLFAIQMRERSVGGYILNMSSFSQWMPFPGLALYGASKAFVRTFSVAFAKEVREDNICVTAVCPAGVATDLYGLTPSWQRIGLRFGVLISADCCARKGLRALWQGRRCIVPDWWNRALIPICKLLPMWVVRPLRRYTNKFQK